MMKEMMMQGEGGVSDKDLIREVLQELLADMGQKRAMRSKSFRDSMPMEGEMNPMEEVMEEGMDPEGAMIVKEEVKVAPIADDEDEDY